MALYCVRIAKGESIWNLSTQKDIALHLCLKDALLCMTADEAPGKAYIPTAARTLADESEISNRSRDKTHVFLNPKTPACTGVLIYSGKSFLVKKTFPKM